MPDRVGDNEANPRPSDITDSLDSTRLSLAQLPLPDDLPADPDAGVSLGVSADSRDPNALDPGIRGLPRWLRPGQPMRADSIRERELAGFRLEGEFRWSNLPQPPRGSEVSSSGMEAARKLTAFKWTVDLAEIGRMRVRFTSKALPLPYGTELRAHSDHYGHLLIWPDGSRYRALSPGAMRALLGEGRADLTPLSRPQLGPATAGIRRFGLSTQRQEISSRTGKLLLDRAKIPEAGEGGALLCRLFMELIAIDPSIAPCSPGEIPLRAQWSFPAGGLIAFEVTAMQNRPDIPSILLQMPPFAATHTPSDLPKRDGAPFLQPEELAALRTKPLEPGTKKTAGGPSEGLLAFNGTDLLRYLLVDGIPIASVLPWQELHVPHLPEGKYLVEWRSFFGSSMEPPAMVELPARTATGASDAGTGP